MSSDLYSHELMHLFGTTINDELRAHPKLVYSRYGRGEGGLISTFSLRSPTKIVIINESNLSDEMSAKLKAYRALR